VKITRIFGILISLLGALTALIPIWIFPVCEKLIETAAGGTVLMKCHWSGQAEIGIGLLVLCSGILLVLLRSPHVRIGVSLMSALSAVLGIAVPAFLIGGCAMETMTCRISTFPAIYVLCALTVALNAANLLLLKKRVNANGT
jgi:hypothetical protein